MKIIEEIKYITKELAQDRYFKLYYKILKSDTLNPIFSLHKRNKLYNCLQLIKNNENNRTI